MGTQLEEYKARVRAKAIEVAREEEWCRSGLNEALEDLDLEPVESHFEMEITVKLKMRVEVGDDFDGYDATNEELRQYFERQVQISDITVEDYENDGWELLEHNSTDCAWVEAVKVD